MEVDDLVERWTLLDPERELVAGKRGATRLGFALLLRFYGQYARFPRGRSELLDDAVQFVARQVAVAASELGFYEWAGSTIAYHRAQIRQHFGFRECSVADAEKLAAWLAATVCERERRPEQVLAALLEHCRDEQIEPPVEGRLERIVRSALRSSEQINASNRVAASADKRPARTTSQTRMNAIPRPCWL